MKAFYSKAKWLVLTLTIITLKTWATGEPSTYFNIYVPPNNDAVHRDVCLVVTAIFDSTSFTITDDGMDGDTDDSKTGILMAGQSYILYIRDNGINDDAQYASGGTLKRDGDYFIITSSKNVYASQSTNSDWQHDWVPGISQSSLSQKFIVYAPKVSSSKRDLNVFAYEDSTQITVRKISTGATTVTGYTNVDYEGGTVVVQKMINRGQDLIHFYKDCRDIMDDGHTYVVESNKPVTLQYGALFGNERDGGGYVPSNTGSSAGSLFYFCVPYQSAGEQEIRVVSWDAGNNVKLYRYNAGAWVLLKDWNMGQRTFQDWVGKTNGNASYPTVFKIECTAGKRASVFEGNWFETGSPGTSDMATMVSSENGTTSGNYFISYMAPPGNQQNVVNPFTGTMFGGRYSHLYIYSQDTAHVTVKDVYTNGTDLSFSYTVMPGRYVDCALSENQWKSIYNGTGTVAGGPERPYMKVESDKPVSVMTANTNDNWMMYFGSSQYQSFSQNISSSTSEIIPGQPFNITSNIVINGNQNVDNVSAEVLIEGGLKLIDNKFIDVTNNQNYTGVVSNEQNLTRISYENLPNLNPDNDYKIQLTLKGSVMDAQGNPVPNNNISDITTILNGEVDGVKQQSVDVESVNLKSYNTNNLLFDFAENTGLENMLTNSWTVSTIDIDGDNDDDLFFTDKTANQPNRLYRNNGNGTFTLITTGAIATDMAQSVSSAWADADNDGDLDVVVANSTIKPNFFYENNGNGTFTKNSTAGFTQQVGYYHHVSWVDVDNDGKLELFLGNYWPTRFNELWKKNADGVWVLWQDNLLSQIPGSGVGATWADFDNDGYQDLLLPSNETAHNRMFRNAGNGNFTEVNNIITQHGGHAVGSTWGDIDNDGDLDLFISNNSNIDNELYVNNGSGNFTLVTNVEVVTDKGHSHGCVFADVDKDCDIDLFVSNDQGTKFLYLNDGNGNFSSKDDEWPNANFGKSYSAAFTDIEGDGDLDMIAATHSNQRNYIFTANNNSSKWVSIRLVGTNSNRSALGAKIRVKAGGKWQTRHVTSQNGLGGQGSFRNHFGLCNATVIDSIAIHWPSGYVQYLRNVSCNQNMVVTEDNASLVKGVAYIDANGNCQKDSTEAVVPNMKFVVTPGNYSVFSDANGKISIRLATGNYQITPSGNIAELSCTSAITFQVSGIGATINLGNIALRMACTASNLYINSNTPAIRRGFPNHYIINVLNVGEGVAQNATVTATLPTALTIDSASVAWAGITTQGNNRVITWNLTNLQPGTNTMVTLYYRAGLSLMPGDYIETSFKAENADDCDTSNNHVTDCQLIYGSIDPNDILAFPVGITETHLISRNQEITYRIRFQNVGNYYAQFVNLIDTLPDNLDVANIHSITSSHPMQLSVHRNTLIFHFPDIMLPDSTSNFDASNGYVQFTLPQKEGNVGGTEINNKALIQFDYNEYITTNTVFHTVLGYNNNLKNAELLIFPNASAGQSYIMAKSTSDGKPIVLNGIKVISLNGAVMRNEKCNSSIPMLDIRNLESGTYVVIATDGTGAEYIGKVVLAK